MTCTTLHTFRAVGFAHLDFAHTITVNAEFTSTALTADAIIQIFPVAAIANPCLIAMFTGNVFVVDHEILNPIASKTKQQANNYGNNHGCNYLLHFLSLSLVRSNSEGVVF